MKDVKTVLCVEDRPLFIKLLSDQVTCVFGDKVEILIARTLDELESVFKERHQDISFILMDTHLVGGTTTYEFVERIHKTFKQPIVATSTEEQSRKLMVKLGCSHSCDKGELLNFLKKWK